MKKTKILVKILTSYLIILFFNQIQQVDASTPLVRPTFHCIGLYWKPDGSAQDNRCNVFYRQLGSNRWKEAMPLWFDYNNHSGATEHSYEYRGSIVNLMPGTTYEIKLKLEKTGTEEILSVQTWSEDLKIKKTITLSEGERSLPLIVSEGGSEDEGYTLYTPPEGKETIIDVKNQRVTCINVEASYVIIRGLTLKGASEHGLVLQNVHNVIIEECDISGWGKIGADGIGVNLNSAIFSDSDQLEKIVVQRCKLHHPRSDSRAWTEGGHPLGPQGISFINSRGYHVIRYNEIYSDEEHCFNDGMGEEDNYSYKGFPNRDSDIYCNLITNCWDDAIESEGGCMNVRIWGNYIDTTYIAFGLAATSLGPHYIWQNFSNFARRGPASTPNYGRSGPIFKLGASEIKWAKGKIYIFHNTTLQPPAWVISDELSGCESGLLVTSPNYHQENITSRNNILHIRHHERYYSIYDPMKYESNSFDYDMYNGKIEAKPGSEAHGIKLMPDEPPPYDPFNGEGEFALKIDSLGYDAAEVLPNFNDGFTGKSPDIGAFENGFPPMRFGINADWTKWLKDIPNSVQYPNSEKSIQPRNIHLYPLYPNPFNSQTHIRYHLSKSIRVSILIYNINGKIIKSFHLGKKQPGAYSIIWDASELASGTYLVRLFSEEFSIIKKCILLK